MLNNLKKFVEKKLKKKITIGRKDKAHFPKLGLENIDIKVDTGAYTSAIHCQKIETKQVKDKEVLTFTLLDPSHEQYNNKKFSTDKFHKKLIKNSFGSSEKRYIIETEILLFGKTHPIELSLSERGEMKFPILIGRRFLMGNFIVDPSRYDLSHKRENKKKAK